MTIFQVGNEILFVDTWRLYTDCYWGYYLFGDLVSLGGFLHSQVHEQRAFDLPERKMCSWLHPRRDLCI